MKTIIKGRKHTLEFFGGQRITESKQLDCHWQIALRWTVERNLKAS